MTNKNCNHLDYSSLHNWMSGKQTRVLANNTIAINEDSYIAVKYHNTIIAEVYQDKLTLNNGGYFTPTTKERLNWFLNEYGFNLDQVNYNWYMRDFTGFCNDNISKFTGSCTYYIHGKCFEGLESKKDKTREKIISRIKAYSREYADNLLSGNIGKPDNGDCFYCHLSFPNSFDHIQSHIEEKYYVPSLLVNAIEFYPVSQIAKYVISDRWGNTGTTDAWDSIAKDQIYKSLWKYCLHCYDADMK